MKAQKAIEDLFAPHQVDEDGNVVKENPFRTMLEEHPFDLRAALEQVRAEQAQGGAYFDGVVRTTQAWSDDDDDPVC